VADACECGNEPSGSRTALFCVITQRVAVNFLQTFRDNLTVPFSVFKNPKESLSHQTEFIQEILWAVKNHSSAVSAPKVGTDKLYRNVGKKLPLLAAQFSATSRRKP